MIKYVGPIVIYKIMDPDNLFTYVINVKIIQGLFEHKRLKAAILRKSEGNVSNLSQLKEKK